MKKYLNLFIVFVAVVGVFVLTGCGNKDKEKINFEGTYVSDDSSEIDITKDEDTYKIIISLYRLAKLENCTVDSVQDEVLTASCIDVGITPIKFTFNYNTKVLTVTDSSWDLLNTGDTFEFNK